MQPNRRILLVDDMPTIHEDFRKILAPPTAAKSSLDAARAALFGDDDDPPPRAAAAPFDLDSAYQGAEGLAKVEAALQAGRPYAMAFVDMRMPPGWDGVETIERLWQADPALQVVICTAYSDTSWDEVLRRLDARDRLLILKKPFDNIEVQQLASALTAKWQMTQQLAQQIDGLEAAVAERSRALLEANRALQAEIDERKQLEAALVQKETLASIGQLAAGIAHEINNPIGYLLSNLGALEGYQDDLLRLLAGYEQALATVPAAAAPARALREELDIDALCDDLPQLLRQSREGLQRVGRIVQDLKAFAQVDALQDWQPAQLQRGIDSTLSLLASRLGARTEVVKDYAELPAVECLPAQINQVVSSLLVNAAQAIAGKDGGDGGGRIVVRTGSSAADEAWFEVADDGAGIEPQVLPRIFDPFFTTRPIGQGSGLGLSLAYGIVQRHRGRIGVQSQPGRGSTFRVTLPLARAGAAATRPPSLR